MHRATTVGDADYSRIAAAYDTYRRPDSRLAARIEAALGSARSVLNVGAGAGAYEPAARAVTAVEPSAVMRARRPKSLGPAVDAVAEELPFEDRSFDAAMAIFSVHQWRDLQRGLSEMRRVARGPVLILTCDPTQVQDFWLGDYCPEVLAVEARRYPGMAQLERALGPLRIEAPPIALDCTDGFQEAYYGRPEMFLDPEARDACSAWSFVEPSVIARFETRLAMDLASGAWDARFGPLRRLQAYVGALRLVTASGVTHPAA
ncbi:class I SAM-dependent methyltransferase [Phenylobacterium immobile]|uniref:class I SAM-dependent methyltransferase n=1 Tax=Phenylobacterium immobile TaxID=21 RepID=UPI000B0F6EE7|nr:class I SAM-dependent methyltransferase [Phenylobacterium immobile]